MIVALIAGWLHSGGLHDVIAWDEANYVFAAREGLIANALQLGDLSQLRHEHAPLTCYAIAVSTAIFGLDEWAVRLPAVLICAISCGLLVLIGFELSRGHAFAARLLVGVSAGLLLATSPASIELAGVIQPHSFVVFFLLLNQWTLCRYLRDQRRRDAVLFGLSLAGQFVTMEYGPIVLFYAFVAVALVRPALLFGSTPRHLTKQRSESGPASRGALLWSGIRHTVTTLIRTPLTMHRDIKCAAIVCLAATAAVWPAGVFLLGIPRNFAYYLLYAAHGHPILFRGEILTHLPRYAYAYWYWLEYPLLLIAIAAALLLIVAWAWRQRGAVAVTLAVFALGLAASVHGAHIMQLCKSIFMIPPIALGGPLAALWLASRLGISSVPIGEWQREGLLFTESTHRRTMSVRPSAGLSLLGKQIAISLLALAAILGGRTVPMSRDGDPNRRLVEMTRLIAAEAAPHDRVLAQGWPMVRYLLHLKFNRPDIVVDRYDPRNYVIDHLGERLAAGEFNWAVTLGPMAAASSDCPVLARLREQWRIADDRSLPGREYRVYRFTANETAGRAQRQQRTAAAE